MGIKSKFLGLAGATSALVWLVQITACTGDDSAAGGAGASGMIGSAGVAGSIGSGGTGSNAGGSTSIAGSSSGGAGPGAGSGGGSSACYDVPSAKPTITDFESYDGTKFAKWSFSLGGDSSSGVLAGTFSYGDEADGFPKTSEVAGPGSGTSMYAMRIADPDVNRIPGAGGLYGGGLGLWLSTCLNATAFDGISFWVRGSSPSPAGTLTVPGGTLTLSMVETLPSTPSMPGGNTGTCSGTGTTCIHPTFAFPVTDTWTQIQVAWADFKAGDAAGTPVTPDGRNIVQIQFGVGLVFEPNDAGVYTAIPAAYELAVDDVAFY